MGLRIYEAKDAGLPLEFHRAWRNLHVAWLTYATPSEHMMVVQNTCPQDGHNVGSLFG